MLLFAGQAGKLAMALRVAENRGVAVPLLTQARQQLKQKQHQRRGGNGSRGGGGSTCGRPVTALPSGKQGGTSLKKGPSQRCNPCPLLMLWFLAYPEPLTRNPLALCLTQACFSLGL